MYQLEKIGERSFLFKAIGSFPPSIAEEAIEDFLKITKHMSEFSAIIDLTDARLINFNSIELIVEFFKNNETKLLKSAVIISENPPLDVEFEYILKQVNSMKRKIVSNLEEAKKWIGIDKIIVQKD
jgi:hypothetical protein